MVISKFLNNIALRSYLLSFNNTYNDAKYIAILIEGNEIVINRNSLCSLLEKLNNNNIEYWEFEQYILINLFGE